MVQELCMNNGVDIWKDVTFKGKPAGQIHIKTAFFPNPGMSMSMGMGMSMGVGVQQTMPGQPVLHPG